MGHPVSMVVKTVLEQESRSVPATKMTRGNAVCLCRPSNKGLECGVIPCLFMCTSVPAPRAVSPSKAETIHLHILQRNARHAVGVGVRHTIEELL